MKKLSILLAILVSLTFSFTSCEPTGTGDENEQTVKLEIDTTGALNFHSMIFYNYGPVTPIFPSLVYYYFQGFTGDVTYNPETGQATGNGYLMQINQACSYHENSFPLANTYTPFELTPDNVIKELFEGATGQILVYEVIDGVIQESTPLDSRNFKAQIIGDTENLTFAVEGQFGEDRFVFTFNGVPTILDFSNYTCEAHDEGKLFNGEEKYAKAEIVYYGETGVLPVNVIEIILVNAQNTGFANFYCYGSLANIENVYGTFKVAAKHEEATMAKGPGISMTEAVAFPSFIARNYSSNGADFYFVKDGSLTVEEGKISFDLTSVNGSKITTNFEGEIDIKSYEEAYGQNAPKKAAALMNISKGFKLTNPGVVKF
jgi:hypothetical protein